MNYDIPFIINCKVIKATSTDVQKAFHDLNRDMNPEFIHVFLDKLERYAKKPDRALFLVEYLEKTIAFATIINKSPLPKTSPPKNFGSISDYACGTGLMVLEEYRRKGVASLLVETWENWATECNILGLWVITHKMSHWYQTNFHFELLGNTNTKGVKKSILSKTF
jgi:GNAT superfamily N-acetyltransferase